MNIFVSWSGEVSHAVATALKNRLAQLLPKVKLWVSDELKGGKRWSQELAEILKSLDSGIVVLTKESLGSPWMYFESGALSKSMESRLYPYLFDLEATDIEKNPLSQFQARTANESGTRRLVTDLNARLPDPLPEHLLKTLFDAMWPDLAQDFENIRHDKRPLNEVTEAKTTFDSSFQEVRMTNSLIDNKYLRKVVTESLERFASGFGTLKPNSSSYSLPYILYPAYLILLLKSFEALTKAVAIVGHDEMFWPQKQGREILLHTKEGSTRVFAFRSKSHLRGHLSTIKEHAARYDVFVIFYDALLKFYSSTPYDFSIIGDINSTSLLGVYDDEDPLGKKIKFSADTVLISRHHDKFTQIRDAAVKVEKHFDDIGDADQLIEQVFSSTNTRLSQLEQRHIEMSSYIHPHEYHLHEEKHAYYLEMMQRMIDLCENHRSKSRSDQERLRLLEFGAGTGLFTKRLLQLNDIDLTSIEIDWACYHELLECVKDVPGVKKENTHQSISFAQTESSNLPVGGRARLRDVFKQNTLNNVIRCINADCRTYNPPGTFDCVLSSFADHHIKTYDKAEYFENIKRNVRPGGLVIIGDEFLPDYDEHDISSREGALNAYHGHIIEETRRKHGAQAEGLIQLEEAALESGLKSIGDFKLSCKIYEGYLTEAGFAFSKELIGPKNVEDVGGVYVYTLELE
jgi:SAM-dependent methyltransferase